MTFVENQLYSRMNAKPTVINMSRNKYFVVIISVPVPTRSKTSFLSLWSPITYNNTRCWLGGCEVGEQEEYTKGRRRYAGRSFTTTEN